MNFIMGHVFDPTSYNYALASLTVEMNSELQERLRDPATSRPSNWFGHGYVGAPTSTPNAFGEGGVLGFVDPAEKLVGYVAWIPGFWYGGANRHRGWNVGLLIFPEFRRSGAGSAAIS